MRFGERPRGDLLALNRQLLNRSRSLPEFAGIGTQQMMTFLYRVLMDNSNYRRRRIILAAHVMKRSDDCSVCTKWQP
jgi:hypothetical protein